MPKPSADNIVARVALALAAAALAGALCQWLHTPLPWMIGPMSVVAALRVSGAPVEALPAGRYIGQWIIGTALGLYFTPVVAQQIAGFAHWMVLAAFLAIGVGGISGMALSRFAAIDRTTAFFGSVPGGAAEMATLGERFGARVDLVAAAQSLRILLVVVIIPALYTYSGVHGLDHYRQAAVEFSPAGLAMLLAATAAGGTLFQLLGVPNAYVLGSLAVAIPLTALGQNWSSMPTVASDLGQLLLGCALGSRFNPDFLRAAHRFVVAVVGSVLLAMVVSGAIGLGLAWITGIHPATLVLATAPGGIAEMCITAKVLQLGVPVVTAFHVTRVAILLTCTLPLYRKWRRWRNGN